MVQRSRMSRSTSYAFVRHRMWPSQNLPICTRPKLSKTYIRHYDVLGFYVPVSDPSVLKVLDWLSQVPDLFGRVLLWEFFELFQVVKKRTLLHEFEHQVNVCFVVEDSVNFQDEGMIQVTLELDFENELVDHFVRLNDLLFDLFKRKNCTRSLVKSHVCSAEPSLAKTLPHIKIINGDFLSGWFFFSAIGLHGKLNVLDIFDLSDFLWTLGRQIKTRVLLGLGVVLRRQHIACLMCVSVVVLCFLDFGRVVFDVVFFWEVVFGLLLWDVRVAFNVRRGHLFGLCVFVRFFVNFSDLLFDTVRTLFVKFVDMRVWLNFFSFWFIHRRPSVIVALWNLVFAFGIKLIRRIEVPRDTLGQVIIAVAFQVSEVHGMSQSISEFGHFLSRDMIVLI